MHETSLSHHMYLQSITPHVSRVHVSRVHVSIVVYIHASGVDRVV